MKQFGVALSKGKGKSFDDTSASRVLFCRPKLISDARGMHVTRERVDRSILHIISHKFFNGHLNFGRHTLISELILRGAPPWLVKFFSGHCRGQAHPAGDGMYVSPKKALEALRPILEKLFETLPKQFRSSTSNHAISLDDLTGQLPQLQKNSKRSSQSRSHVLPAAFDQSSFLAIRIVDHLRYRCVAGLGPSSAGANLLLNLAVINWITSSDLETSWNSNTAFHSVNDSCAVGVWNRKHCRAEIRRILETPTLDSLASLRSAFKGKLSNIWSSSCLELQSWLKGIFPNVTLPENPEDTVSILGVLVTKWMRFNLPPFLLTASSPQLTTPTVDRASFLRLAKSVSKNAVDTTEVLAIAPPKPRNVGNFSPKNTPLQQAIDALSRYSSRTISAQSETAEDDLHESDQISSEATDWARAANLIKDLSAIDVSDHAPAATYVRWLLKEAGRWKTSLGDRLAIGSMGTYTSGFKSALLILRPTDDMKLWDEEWFELLHFLKTTCPGKTPEERNQTFAARVTALKRFTKILKHEGYQIPNDLFDATEPANDGMRKSATSTLVFEADEPRISGLMKQHFSRFATESKLASFYSDSHWEISGRSTEFGSMSIDCLDEFNRFVFSHDKFSGFKSDHAWRMLKVSENLASRFEGLVTTVVTAYPNSKFLYLFDNPNDWSFVVQLEKAFSRALSQVTGCDDARAHLTRHVSAFKFLFPKWEEKFRSLLNGTLTARESKEYTEELAELGFNHLIQLLQRIAHGHPVTFIKYYLSIWDLLLSVYCRASLCEMEEEKLQVFRPQHEQRTAFNKAQTRAGKAFNPSLWVAKKWLTELRLPPFSALRDATSKRKVKIPEPDSRASSRLQIFQYTTTRLIGFNDSASSLLFKIDDKSAAKAEELIANVNAEKLIKGHQAKSSVRGRNAMIDVIKSQLGEQIYQKLSSANSDLLILLSEALSTRRTYNQQLPGTNSLITWLIKMMSCLVPKLGILIQFGGDRLASDDVIRIENCHPRVFVGPSDPQLGGRPRLSIVDANDSTNLVTRARLTGLIRCAVAAQLLLNSY